MIVCSDEDNFSDGNSWEGKDDVAAVLHLEYCEWSIFCVIVGEVVGI